MIVNPDDVDMSTVMRVMPENVAALWPQLERILKPPVMAAGTHTMEDVRRSIMALRTQLWVHIRKTSGLAIPNDLKCPECKDGDLESHFSGREGPFYACPSCGWDEETHATPTVVSCAVTDFADYPSGLFVRVWLAGAIPTRKMDIEAFVEMLDRWRIANGCIEFEIIGRHGWLRVFPWAKVKGLMMRGSP